LIVCCYFQFQNDIKEISFEREKVIKEKQKLEEELKLKNNEIQKLNSIISKQKRGEYEFECIFIAFVLKTKIKREKQSIAFGGL
jgi:hypothetical protein